MIYAKDVGFMRIYMHFNERTTDLFGSIWIYWKGDGCMWIYIDLLERQRIYADLYGMDL